VTTAQQKFFVTCAPGVEPLLHAEARELGLRKVERQVGGIYFEGTLADARRANLWLRTGVRVLMRVARFEAQDADDLYAGVGLVEWGRFLWPDGVLVVDAQSTDSVLEHTRFVEQRTKDAIVDQLRTPDGVRPSVDRDDADLGVHVHLFKNRCTISVDTSGVALHRRGYRREQGPAPLAETLAAALVLESTWDRRAPLLDPFCGSGTIPIEAALIATDTAPGLFRRFGFERWPGHDAAAFAAERREAEQRRKPLGKRTVLGSDSDPAQLERARANAAGAGLADVLRFEPGDALEFAPRPGWNAWVVSNLPYGQRIGGGADIAALYRAFAARLVEHARGFTVGLLSSDGPEARALELPGTQRRSFLNGGLACRFTTGRLPD
jgi:putative N6-adenine-specific DNA methylase